MRFRLRQQETAIRLDSQRVTQLRAEIAGMVPGYLPAVYKLGHTSQ
jgi:hypothetical protein